jgi:two-component system OmpR family response regulator
MVQKLRVLIVDDEDELAHALVERLQIRGMDAHGVTTGKEALDRIRTEPFDVVLLDVRMPGLGGLKVIKEIKDRRPGLQVIMLTGHSSAQDAQQGMDLGAYKYLQKPVNIEDLCRVLRAAVASEEDCRE